MRGDWGMRAGRVGGERNAKGQDRGSEWTQLPPGSPTGHVTRDPAHDQACDVTHDMCGEASRDITRDAARPAPRIPSLR